MSVVTGIQFCIHNLCLLKIGDDGQVEVQYTQDKVGYTVSLQDIEGASTLQEGDIRMVKWTDRKYYEAKVLNISKYKVVI